MLCIRKKIGFLLWYSSRAITCWPQSSNLAFFFLGYFLNICCKKKVIILQNYLFVSGNSYFILNVHNVPVPVTCTCTCHNGAWGGWVALLLPESCSLCHHPLQTRLIKGQCYFSTTLKATPPNYSSPSLTFMISPRHLI